MQSASALSAVWQFFVRDLLGQAGGIAFASATGGSLDASAKQWRLFADIMNDAGMALDLASPLLPGGFMLCACLGSVCRAMVGLAAGATHAALTQHFTSAGGSPADVSAKAESRERAASIVGSLLGMALTQRVADHIRAAWLVFAALTVLHVWANVRAMRCLVLVSLSPGRMALLHEHWLAHGVVLTPRDVAARESLLAPPFAAAAEWLLRSRQRGTKHIAIEYGARASTTIERCGPGAKARLCAALMPAVQDSSGGARQRSPRYSVLVSSGPGSRHTVHVLLHHGTDARTQLHAYLHALHVASLLRTRRGNASAGDVEQRSARWAEKQMLVFLEQLRAHGWQLQSPHLPRPAWTVDWPEVDGS